MFSLLHNYSPQPIFFSIGILSVHWYGLFLVAGISLAIFISLYLAKAYKISRDQIFDISFWLIISGLVGARIYEVLLMFPYYLSHPSQIIKVWEGGLAIHGAILGGLITLIILARHYKISFFKLGSLFVPGLAFGQAVGRVGNYFNQELFGLPTSLPWGIPIDIINRPPIFIANTHFHPTFLYESLGCLLIGSCLLGINWRKNKQGFTHANFYFFSVLLYVILYASLRFSLEFIRIDETPLLWGWRWPQIASLIMLAVALSLLAARFIYDYRQNQKNS